MIFLHHRPRTELRITLPVSSPSSDPAPAGPHRASGLSVRQLFIPETCFINWIECCWILMCWFILIKTLNLPYRLPKHARHNAPICPQTSELQHHASCVSGAPDDVHSACLWVVSAFICTTSPWGLVMLNIHSDFYECCDWTYIFIWLLSFLKTVKWMFCLNTF